MFLELCGIWKVYFLRRRVRRAPNVCKPSTIHTQSILSLYVLPRLNNFTVRIAARAQIRRKIDSQFKAGWPWGVPKGAFTCQSARLVKGLSKYSELLDEEFGGAGQAEMNIWAAVTVTVS